jgi:hypothetical protein
METPFTDRDREALGIILTQQEEHGKILEALVQAVVALRAAPAVEPVAEKSSKWMDWLKFGVGTGAAVADQFVKNPENRATMGKANQAATTAIDIMDRLKLGTKREKT